MKVYIHPHVTGALRTAIKDLLNAIGCEIVDELEDCEIDLTPSEPAADDDNDDVQIAPACIVVLEPGLTEDDLEPELTAAIAHGCRVIGVWGPGADGDLSPLADYGADTVAWDAERIHDAVCGVPQHQDPAGAATPTPTPTTGGC
ncbi:MULTISPECIES: hypothetical protein [unclassified Sphingomonas]|uniref:hypothetical protein n=1 Tax=unclassified Sphingomonas TaxID=196159 RepID=UPI002151D087|nr:MULTISPECIES: hypothetical protein [unclassified Sphingomonas]MCR5870357.1 hypothetical protein [Sphingomonas sp. J344]UUY01308.1 hypothetical protein LRS08_09915 [Sphingomonas sp. J315]